MKKNLLIYSFLLLGLYILSCKKSDYLDVKPSDALVVPQTLSDFQAILDNDKYMAGNTSFPVLPNLEEVGADNYYVNSDLGVFGTGYVNIYIWKDEDIYKAAASTNWSFGYRSVFYSNVVLDGIKRLDITSDQQQSFNNILGGALFHRAHMFYHFAQVWAPPYDQATADTDLGIVLRLSSDINEVLKRSTVQQTYDRIINDLKEAIPLLPVVPLYKTRPSKPAAYAQLARVFLSMRQYANAYLYADSALQLQSTLMDYNSINDEGPFTLPFTMFNDEVIFHGVLISSTVIGSNVVDTSLYKSYDDNDLRKQLFYDDWTPYIGGYYFRGSYDGSYDFFAGIATDEVYLIRAECLARAGNVNAAMNDLNTLMIKRWKNNGTWTPFTAVNATDALNKILIERRKELVFRGIRWTDLRRLNKEGANITLTRVYNGQTYTLPPNSLHYTYLIPPDVIGFNPSISQNPR